MTPTPTPSRACYWTINGGPDCPPMALSRELAEEWKAKGRAVLLGTYDEAEDAWQRRVCAAPKAPAWCGGSERTER